MKRTGMLVKHAGKELLLRWFNEANDPETLLQELRNSNQASSPQLHIKLVSAMKHSFLMKALENGRMKMVSAMIEIVVDCISPYLIDCPHFMAQMYWICLNLLVLSEWYCPICHQPYCIN